MFDKRLISRSEVNYNNIFDNFYKNYRNIFLYNKNIFVLNFNWGWVVFYSFFIAYTYYGALAPSFQHLKMHPISDVVLILALAMIQSFIGWFSSKYAQDLQESVAITASDIFVWLSLISIYFLLSSDRLNYSLFSDELSYAGSAHGHAIYLAFLLARNFHYLANIEFKYIIQIISLSFILAIVIIFYFSNKLSSAARIKIFVALFICGRFLFSIKGGNGSPHPPLHLVPPLIFGAIGGINDFNFKFSYFFCYITFLVILFKMFRRRFSFYVAYVSIIAIGSMPILLNLSSVVEHSFWSLVSFSIVFVDLLTAKNMHYFRLISLVSISTMMRQPSFIALIPILYLYISYIIITQKKFYISEIAFNICKLLSTTTLFILFLLTSIVNGTPSTSPLENASNLDRVSEAVINGTIEKSIINSISFYWVLFFPFAFIPLNKKYKIYNVSLFGFFLCSVYVYYSISPSLWGFSKYQAEYAVPLIIAGFYLVMYSLYELGLSLKILVFIGLILISFNVLDMSSGDHRGSRWLVSYDNNSEISNNESSLLKSGLTAIPYEYKSAYALIKNMGLCENTYSIGATYGVLPEIMNGYSSHATIASYDIYLRQKNNQFDPELSENYVRLINIDTSIKALIIGSIENKEILISALHKEGWTSIANFRNSRYGTNVIVMRRS